MDIFLLHSLDLKGIRFMALRLLIILLLVIAFQSNHNNGKNVGLIENISYLSLKKRID